MPRRTRPPERASTVIFRSHSGRTMLSPSLRLRTNMESPFPLKGPGSRAAPGFPRRAFSWVGRNHGRQSKGHTALLARAHHNVLGFDPWCAVAHDFRAKGVAEVLS